MKKIFIYGSCVSRDAFEFSKYEFDIVKYVARSSIGSAFLENLFSNVKLENIASEFQRRMVEIDINKNISSLLQNTDFDLILWDPIDERFDLIINEFGEICTASNEFLLTKYVESKKENQIRIIKSGTDEHFNYWLRGWNKLIEILKKNNSIEKLLINKVFWTENSAEYEKTFPPSRIISANNFLRKIYSEIEKTINLNQIINYDSSLIKSNPYHKWGPSPFHYIDDFYRHTINVISQKYINDTKLNNENTTLIQKEKYKLSQTIRWYAFENHSNAATAALVDIIISCDLNVGIRQALVALDFYDKNEEFKCPSGFGTSNNKEFKIYRYIDTGAGQQQTSFSLTIPNECKKFRIGIMAWWAKGEIILDYLSIKFTPSPKPSIMISVDVEALPGRASKNHVDRLIFGKFDDKKPYGIARICDIFDEYNIKATFFIDYSTVPIHGKLKIYEAAEFLLKRGHDIQLHMHSEVLIRHMGWPYNNQKFPSFATIDKSTAIRCIEFGVNHFRENLGKSPEIFRPGGMKHSLNMYEAISHVGIPAVSATFKSYDIEIWKKAKKFSKLSLPNGLIEVPLDVALDPLIPWEPFEREINTIQSDRIFSPTASMLMHSTSLLFREKTNQAEYQGYHKPYEIQLRKYIESLIDKNNFITHSELINSTKSAANVDFDELYFIETKK